MDIKQQGTHASATKKGKEWITFSCKVIFEATEEKLKNNSTRNFQCTHMNLCYSAYKHKASTRVVKIHKIWERRDLGLQI